jgi:hypothetical protein
MSRSVLPVAAILVWAASCLGQVHAPWVRTDRSVDCHTRQSILADLVKPDMNDEQKAVAIWRFMMDHTWHFSRADDNHGMRVINCYGYSLCGTLSRAQNWLRYGAFPASYVADGGCSRYGSTFAERRKLATGWLIDSWERLDGGQKRPGAGRLGHSMGEVFYDGHWHFLDCHAGFFVYTADRGRIAGYFDLCSDPTLVSDPVKTSDPFMPYDGGDPSFYYRFSGGGGRGVPDPKAEVKRRVWPPHSMDVTLRPGERYVRTWQPIAGAFKWSSSWKGQWDRQYIDGGPRHVPSGEATWRRYANGRFVYRLPLDSPACKAGLTDAQNVAFRFEDGKGAALHPADAAKPMQFAVVVASPYALIRGRLTGRIVVADGGRAAVRIVPANRRPAGKAVWESAKPGAHDLDVGYDKLLGYHYGYRAVVRVSGGGGVDALALETICQLNPLTLPRLRPGENRVTFTCPQPQELAACKLTVTYVWQEKSGTKRHSQPVTRSPQTSRIDVGEVGTTDPLDPSYMRRLELECRPR